MRREGTPAWMQVVERRLEQAAEEARSRPAQAGIQAGAVGGSSEPLTDHVPGLPLSTPPNPRSNPAEQSLMRF